MMSIASYSTATATTCETTPISIHVDVPSFLLVLHYAQDQSFSLVPGSATLSADNIVDLTIFWLNRLAGTSCLLPPFMLGACHMLSYNAAVRLHLLSN